MMRKIDLEKERVFENTKVQDRVLRSGQSRFYWATKIPSDLHLSETLERIGGAKVLEIGCSSGRDAKLFSQRAASYLGVDISDQAIKQASSIGLRNAEFLCVDGHRLPSNDRQYDFVIVNSLLHHLDLGVSLREIHRVLRDDGVLVFREPLGINPLFWFYRWVTPSARTPDEKPFSLADINLMKRYFVLNDVRWFGFLSIASAFLKSPKLREVLTRIDDAISGTPVRYAFWQFCGFAKKKSLLS